MRLKLRRGLKAGVGLGSFALATTLNSEED